jgi:hypothetical protein
MAPTNKELRTLLRPPPMKLLPRRCPDRRGSRLEWSRQNKLPNVRLNLSLSPTVVAAHEPEKKNRPRSRRRQSRLRRPSRSHPFRCSRPPAEGARSAAAPPAIEKHIGRRRQREWPRPARAAGRQSAAIEAARRDQRLTVIGGRSIGYIVKKKPIIRTECAPGQIGAWNAWNAPLAPRWAGAGAGPCNANFWGDG